MKSFQTPWVGMFASTDNHQLPLFVARNPRSQAMEVDSLKCPLKNIDCCYANPPWTIIGKWLHRLRENRHVTCMIIVPYWVSSAWWPLLVKLHMRGAPSFLIPPFWGMFRNCWGELMPPPKWPLVCTWLSGKAYRPNKSAIKLQKLTWVSWKVSTGMKSPSSYFGHFAPLRAWMPWVPHCLKWLDWFCSLIN